MSKRGPTEETAPTREVRPCFPMAGHLADIHNPDLAQGMIVRDNTEYLAKMEKATLFTRPTQLGKSTLLALAENVYSKRKKAPPNVAKSVPVHERNAGYVIRFDFLRVVCTRDGTKTWQANLSKIDSNFSLFIKDEVSKFLGKHRELEPYFSKLVANADAAPGAHLVALAQAVAEYQDAKGTREFLMVLVDEYDRPLRETLFELLEQKAVREKVTAYCPNYISFFSSCKAVAQALFMNRVWVTGVVPIVLDLISDFKPNNLTFKAGMEDALGLRDADVDIMLQRVQAAEHFAGEDYTRLREAIRNHANHLQFLSGSALYHTRMANELMNVILDRDCRAQWLESLETLPANVTRECAPSAVFKLLKKNNECRKIAKDLVAGRDIRGVLNRNQNLPDVVGAAITKDNYLTLLVHLGIVSVRGNKNGPGQIFRSTSRFFRSEFLNEMLGVTLAPLFKFADVDDIYKNQNLLQEFVETMPASGMSKMIKWAKQAKGKRILELQFQSFLIGELHDHFFEDTAEISPTQEDTLDDSEPLTDIRLQGESTLLVLELKQKPSEHAGPTPRELDKYHNQLDEYMEELSTAKKDLIVAGFVVVMYAGGTKFHIERTRYGVA